MLARCYYRETLTQTQHDSQWGWRRRGVSTISEETSSDIGKYCNLTIYRYLQKPLLKMYFGKFTKLIWTKRWFSTHKYQSRSANRLLGYLRAEEDVCMYTCMHRRCQDFCLGGGTRPTPPSLASVVHTFEAVAGSWGSMSAPAVSRVMGGAPERIKIAKNIGGMTFVEGFL